MKPLELEILRRCHGKRQTDIRRELDVSKTHLRRILEWARRVGMVERDGRIWTRTELGDDALAGRFDAERSESIGRPALYKGGRMKAKPRQKTQSGSGVIAPWPYKTGYRFGPSWLQS